MPNRFRLVKARKGAVALDALRLSWEMRRFSKTTDGKSRLWRSIRFPDHPVTNAAYWVLQGGRAFYPIENYFRIKTGKDDTAGVIAWGVTTKTRTKQMKEYNLPVGAIEIGNAAIHPRYRGQGAMAFAIKRVVSKLREQGHTIFFMRVNAHNEAMKATAQKAGFAVHKRVSAPRKPENDFLVYTRFG